MGEIVLAACTSHSPGMTGFRDIAEGDKADNIYEGFRKLAEEIETANPDAIVAISSEHFTNFFVSNLPSLAIGTATDYDLPATDAFSNFLKIPKHRYPGHPELGEEIFKGLIKHEFDPALVAGGYGFDESFAVPLTLLAGGKQIPIVPILLNAIHPPYPTLNRCYRLGKAIATIIEKQKIVEKIMVLGTGGLSHWVGLARAGEIDEKFDAMVIETLQQGQVETILELNDDELDKSGNGAHEIRSWIAVAGATSGKPFDILAYEPIPAWLTGTCVARVNLESNTAISNTRRFI